jgi:hypothetical protein
MVGAGPCARPNVGVFNNIDRANKITVIFEIVQINIDLQPIIDAGKGRPQGAAPTSQLLVKRI